MLRRLLFDRFVLFIISFVLIEYSISVMIVVVVNCLCRKIVVSIVMNIGYRYSSSVIRLVGVQFNVVKNVNDCFV